jgi:hypothetical protein
MESNGQRKPSVLVSLSEDERREFQTLSDEQIAAALEKGGAERSAAQSAAQVAPLPTRIMFR